MNKQRSWFGWLGLAAAVVGLSVYTSLLLNWQGKLHTQLDQLEQQRIAKRRANKRSVAAMMEAQLCVSIANTKDARLRKMLRVCRSRDEFVVREGPRIAWSELSPSAVGIQKIGFYLPEGKHRLHAALLEHTGVKPRRSELRNETVARADLAASADDSPFACSWDLGPAAEVYEFQLHASASAEPSHLAVLGAGNAPIAANRNLNIGKLGKGKLQVTELGFAFPSQLKPPIDSLMWQWPAGLSKPVTDLATAEVEVLVDGEPRKAELRLWIESESPACVSAPRAAGWHDTLMVQLTLTNEEQLRKQTAAERQKFASLSYQEQLELAFSNTFEPYDGSGRFCFRPGVFEALQAARFERLSPQ